MASSRWKRFAFFDRHTLNLPSQVLEDLLPEDTAGGGSARRNSTLLNVSMVINTAALPSKSSSGVNPTTSSSSSSDTVEERAEQQPLSAMWSSLTACSQGREVSTEETKNIHLPSQQQQQSHTTAATTLSDGLVLLWVASSKTQYVHCLDITLRCSAMDHEVELDGWRGYFDSVAENGIVDIATCRMPTPSGQHSPLYVACLTTTSVKIHVDPHLHLSCRLPVTFSESSGEPSTIQLATPWNESTHGRACTMDMNAEGLLAIGTDLGYVLLYDFSSNNITLQITIPPPPAGGIVTSLKLANNSIFCAYQKGMGISCFDFSGSGITARHDLDSRHVLSSSLVDISCEKLLVARPDGLYTYSQTQKIGVSPIDGTKNAICAVPPPISRKQNMGSSYALVASTDTKSGRYV